MDLIFLAGESSKNKEWVEKVEDVLKPFFGKTKIQYYKNWETDANVDFEHEFDFLKNNIKSFSSYAVFAKSVGTVLALKGVYEKVLAPKKCIFLGTALNWAKRVGFDPDLWLRHYSVPTLFIQKEYDPAFNFNGLEKALREKKVKNYKTIKIPGDDHYYGDLEQIKLLIMEFIK